MGMRTDLSHQRPLSRDSRSAERQFNTMKSRVKQRENAVIAHEVAHQTTAGHLGSSPTYGYKTESVTMPDGTTKSVQYIDSGEVQITLPALPSGPAKNATERRQLESILSDYNIVEQAAVAPGSLAGGLSDSDQAIAATAASRQQILLGLLAQSDAFLEQQVNQQA